MAVMKNFVLKNSSGSDQTIDDMGFTIADSSQIDLHSEFEFDRIYGSDDLRDLLTAGTLVMNDGTSDLSSAEAINYVFSESKYESLEAHYTKTQMQTSGSSTLHWDNLSNVPALGWSGMHEPVKYLVTGIGLASAPGSPDDLDVYVDDSDHYQSYNGATWDDLGLAASGDRVIDLSNADEDITEFNGTTWTAEAQAGDQTIVAVDQAKNAESDAYVNAQYVYDTTGTTWKLWARTDFSGHLNGGANKHDGSEIDIETSRTNLGITAPTDLESALGDIDTAVGAAQTAADGAQSDIDDHIDGTANKHDASEVDVETSRSNLGITAPTDLESALGNIDTAVGAIDLDSAYDTSAGSGAGRTITADSGPVELNRAAGTDSPFRIVPKAALPTTNLSDGDVDVRDGIMWVYDGTRSLWVATCRSTMAFGENHAVITDRYLFVYGGQVISSLSGPRMVRDAVITGISCQLSASGTVDVNIRKNGVATDILTLSVSAAQGAQSASSNVSLSAGDWLSCFVEPTGTIRNPMITLEYAWRG